MSQNEETKAEMVVARGDWAGFIASLERFMTLHQKTLQRFREMKTRNEALRTELRSALALPIVKSRIEKGAPLEVIALQWCRYCGREIELSAKFCDRCGRNLVFLVCECGQELGRSDKFCDSCGSPVSPN